jgi:MFS family permease
MYMNKVNLKQNRGAAMLALLTACAAVFLTALDQTVVVTALPQIITDLQIPLVQLDRAAWIISGYLLGYVIAMPLMGRVSDMYGRRRVFVICLAIFALGSLFCGLSPILGSVIDISFLQNFGLNIDSPGLIWLVAARFVQAAGGGAVVPVAMAVAGDFYGEDRRGVALGLIGMVTEAGGVLGPLYGSIIVQYWGWQTIFYLNLPIVAVLLFFIWRFIPPSLHLKERIDLPGALLLGASLICLSLGLSQEAAQITTATSATSATNTPIQNNPWLLAAALIFLACFIALEIFKERRHNWPIVELSIFKRAAFSATSLVSLLVGAALIIAMADIPIFIATVLGRPPLDSGLALLRLTAMIPVGALLGGWLCGHITCRWTAILGLVPTAIGFWLMHLWPLNVNWTQITVSTLIGGLGFGLVIAPIGVTAINSVAKRQIGMASSTVIALRMVGMILGLAALTSWGLGRFRLLASAFKPPANLAPFSPGYNDLYAKYLVSSAHEVYTAIFLAAGILCLIAIIPSLFLEGKRTPLAANTSRAQVAMPQPTASSFPDGTQEHNVSQTHSRASQPNISDGA